MTMFSMGRVVTRDVSESENLPLSGRISTRGDYSTDEAPYLQTLQVSIQV
jgi:hypothetical protein